MQTAAHAVEQEFESGGNMSALRKENGFDLRIIQPDPIPKPEGNPEGKILDPQGKTVAPAPHGFMARLDVRAKEDITLSKGTLWLLGAAVVIVNLAFLFGGSLLAWAREDQSQKEQMIQMKSDMQLMSEGMRELKADFKEVQKVLQADSIQKAKIDGFKAGVAETQTKEK